MPKTYSYDLRTKVIESIELDGLKICQAAKLFHITHNKIAVWLKRKRLTGDFKPRLNKPPGHSHRITDWEKFREFVQNNGDKTQEQMAQLWAEDISSRTISRALKRIGFTRKKNLWVQRT